MRFFVDKFGITAVLAFLWVAVGVVGTMWFGGLHFTTSLYFITQIVTTIGYGDIAISRHPSIQAFMTFYVLLGVCVAANFLNDVFKRLVDGAQNRLSERLQKVEDAVERQRPGVRRSLTLGQIERAAASHHESRDLKAAFAIFAGFVAFGTVFYALVESCSCSYGVTRVEGCDPDNCAATNGYRKTFASSIYMSVITLTTVGFGDMTPETHVGRWVGVVWMLAGVLSFGNFVAAFAAWMDAVFHKDHSVAFGRKMFNRVDRDKNGYLTREEFTTWMMLKEGWIKFEALEDVNRVFESLAAREGERTAAGEPKLGFETLAEYFHDGGFEDEDEDSDSTHREELRELTRDATDISSAQSQ